MPDVTFEELEAAANVPAAPDLEKQLVSGEGVPEDLQGKSTKDVLARMAGMAEALRISEEARKNALLMAEMATKQQAVAAPVVAPVAPTAVKDLTAEELDELVKTDPTKALMLGMEQTRRKTIEALESRLGPMATSMYSATEAAAKQKYATEFQMFDADIRKVIEDIPRDKRGEILSDPKAWDTMITYIRGQNMDKLISAGVEAAIEKRLGTARGAQAAATPASIASGVQSPTPVVQEGVVWDSTTIDIMQKVLGKDDSPATRAEWAKWSNRQAGGM